MPLLSLRQVVSALALLFLALFARFVSIGYRYRTRAREVAHKHGIPILEHSMIWGHLAMVGKLLKKYPSDVNGQCIPALIAREYPEVSKYDANYLDLWPIGWPMLSVFNPDMMAQFCQEPSLPKHRILQDEFQPYTQCNDLVNMEGQTWKTWRSILNPGFSARNVTALVPDMVEETLVYRKWLESIATTGETVALEDQTMKMAVDVIGRVVLGNRLHCQTTDSQLYKIMRRQTSLLVADYGPRGLKRILNPLRPFLLWNNNRLFRNICLPYIVQGIQTQSRKEGSKTINDLAIKSYLKEHSGEGTIDSKWIDIALSQFKIFLFAGHDTTSSTLCFAYSYLYENPEKLAKVRAELDDVFGNDPPSDRHAIVRSPEILNRLIYLTAVIKETLRMMPPIGSVRVAPKDFFLVHPETGTKLPTENWMLFSCSFALHRHPAFFPRPDEFIPERFLAKEGEELYVRKNSFRTFELGPRSCIGQELAMTEMRMVIALTIRDMDLIPMFPSDGDRLFGSLAYQAVNDPDLSAHPKWGMPMKVVLRK